MIQIICDLVFFIKVIMLKTIKETIYRHRYKILAGVSFTAAAYLFYLSLNDNTSIKLSSFLEALTNHQLE